MEFLWDGPSRPSAAALDGSRNPYVKILYDHAVRTWPTDVAVPLLLRAVGTLAMTTNTEALAVVAQAFLSALVPQSAGAELLSRGPALHFGSAAAIDVPGVGLRNADFVAEGQPIPVAVPPPAPEVRLNRHKLAAICTATSELLLSPSAEDLIRQFDQGYRTCIRPRPVQRSTGKR